MLKTVEMDPTYALAHWYLGLAYEQRGMFAEAIEEFQKAVDTDPNNYLYWGNLGDAYRWSPGQRDKMLERLMFTRGRVWRSNQLSGTCCSAMTGGWTPKTTNGLRSSD